MTHTLKLPSTGEELTYRPFLVKEEKILMMAMQGGETTDIVRALRQIIASCVTSNIDTLGLPTFDLEYIFLQLRARSVGEIIDINYSFEEEICEKTGNTCQFKTQINIDDIQVEHNKEHKDLVDITDSIKVKLNYPKIEDSIELSNLDGKNVVDATFKMIRNSIEYIMEGVEIYKASDHTEQELDEFLNSLSSSQFMKIQKFFDTMPKLKKQVIGICGNCGKKNERTLEGLADFFV